MVVNCIAENYQRIGVLIIVTLTTRCVHRLWTAQLTPYFVHTSHPDLHPIKDETTGLDGLYWCVDYPWPMWDRDVSMDTMVKLYIIGCKRIANVLLFAVALLIKCHCWQLIKIWLSGELGPHALCSLGICFGWIPGRSVLSIYWIVEWLGSSVGQAICQVAGSSSSLSHSLSLLFLSCLYFSPSGCGQWHGGINLLPLAKGSKNEFTFCSFFLTHRYRSCNYYACYLCNYSYVALKPMWLPIVTKEKSYHIFLNQTFKSARVPEKY